MPRPASWLPRLYDITRSVTNSVRSHYQRRDLELLFELQPRAAQKLLKMLPTTEVGTGHLVSRETLLSFLARVRDAEDTTVLFEQLRQDRHNSSRKKIRSLVQTDFAPASFASLPQRVTLSPGRLEVTFQTVDELAESLMKIAQLLAEEGDLFATSYEPKKPPKFDDEADEVQRMFAELEAMEAQRAAERVKARNLGGSPPCLQPAIQPLSSATLSAGTPRNAPPSCCAPLLGSFAVPQNPNHALPGAKVPRLPGTLKDLLQL